MLKQIGVTMAVIIGLMLLVGIAAAETACISPCPACTPTLNCPEIPACPSLTCSPMSNALPGLWEARFKGSKKCGQVTIYPDQMVIDDMRGGLTWLLIDKKMILEQVEACQ